MNLFCHVHGFPPSHPAGAEWMLFHMMTGMVRRGHQVRVLCGKGKLGFFEGTFEGIEVFNEENPDVETDALYLWADVVITHLERCSVAKVKCEQLRRPLVHLVHNESYLAHHRLNPNHTDLAIMNSNWLARRLHWRGPQIVVQPPIPFDYYSVERDEDANCITLLNLSDNKGGPVFWKIAEALPNLKFLAIKGAYEAQVIPKEVPPNVELLDSQYDVRPILKRTRILLMPSRHETWGRAGAEAFCSGIPVLATPTDGLKEALSSAAIFCDRDDIHQWVSALQRLQAPTQYQEASRKALERAKALDPEPALNRLEQALLSIQKPFSWKVDVLACEPHFFDHTVPVFEAFPVVSRGKVVVHDTVFQRALDRGVVCQPYQMDAAIQPMLRHRIGPIIVSSSRDFVEVRDHIKRDVVHMEHGAGQTYTSTHPSYAGGNGKADVKLFLVPGQHPAAANLKSYPNIPCVEVGCPKLDPFMAANFVRPKNPKPVIVFGFHWDCDAYPETQSAFRFYRDWLSLHVQDMRRWQEKWRIIGHGHPRGIVNYRPWYQSMGIEVWEDFGRVLAEADVFLMDNSSTMFEFAATDRPVVVLNCPLYRRKINHGMRFWEYTDVGVQCDDPGTLEQCIEQALADEPSIRSRRAEISDAVYTLRDGQSASAAAEAIIEHCLFVGEEKITIEESGMQIIMIAKKSFMGDKGEANDTHGLTKKGTKFVAANEERANILMELGMAERADGIGLPERRQKLITQAAKAAAPTRRTEPQDMTAGMVYGQRKTTAVLEPDVKVETSKPEGDKEIDPLERKEERKASQAERMDKEDGETAAPGSNFKCSYCPKKFETPAQAAKHTRSKHPDSLK